jgi:hypothetical protein
MVQASFPMTTELFASGNSPLGRGVKGAIPLHIVFESKNLLVQPRNSLRTLLTLTAVLPAIPGTKFVTNQSKN